LSFDPTRPRQLCFQPLDIHLQAADLPVELLFIGGLVGPTLSAVDEELGHLAHERLLPGRHLARADAELARQLRRRSVARGCGQGHLGFEGRPEDSSFSAHRLAPKRVPSTLGAPPHQRARKSGSTSAYLAYTGPGGFFIHRQQAPGDEVRTEPVPSPQAPEVFSRIVDWLGLPERRRAEPATGSDSG
jgi:hypothetical protein